MVISGSQSHGSELVENLVDLFDVLDLVDLFDVLDLVDLFDVLDLVDLFDVLDLVDLFDVLDLVDLFDVLDLVDLFDVLDLVDLFDVLHLVDLFDVLHLVDLFDVLDLVDLFDVLYRVELFDVLHLVDLFDVLDLVDLFDVLHLVDLFDVLDFVDLFDVLDLVDLFDVLDISIQSSDVINLDSNIELNPEETGVTITVKDLNIDLYTEYDATYRVLFIPIHLNGAVTARLSDFSLIVTLGLGVDPKSHPEIWTKDCQASIGELRLDFKDSKWLNLIGGFFEDEVKQAVLDLICPRIEQVVNTSVEAKLSQLQLTTEMAGKFIFDYSFLEPIVVTSQYLQCSNKGEFFWKTDTKTERPFSPAPLPDDVDNSKMVYLWISEYTAQTLAYVAHIHDFLQYKLTKNLLPKKWAGLLDTSCNGTLCAGSVFPQLAQKFPNSELQILIKSSKVPEVQITDQLSVTGSCNVDISVVVPGGSSTTFLAVQTTLSLVGNVIISNDTIYGDVNNFSLKVDNMTTTLEDIQQNWINEILNEGLNMFIIPQLKAVSKQGFKLPVIMNVTLIDTGVKFVKDAVVLESNVMYRNFI
ncbi:hypothetical protein Btru_053310 [Bulinus truncatus]|nr:hypothetical protein Btru_053310 [Bulinus truncatus]